MKKIHLLIIGLILTSSLLGQVSLRDSSVFWRHHSFSLNDDFGMNQYSSADEDLDQIMFEGKVIENELIRLVVIPGYGARVISFVYKPTGHEYLYQSECGSPYGMNDGNFYYDWLMVYGGIFPTFPEPEHGKSWLREWEYEVISNNGDSVIIAMEYTDNDSFNRSPGKFNNGITNITCRIEVAVFKGSSLWDFNVSLINNKPEPVRYEYWTCTTLSPGSEIGNTGNPLNSEMIVPIEKYRAGWSPGAWIGNINGIYNFSNIDFLDKWTNMGIAYAYDLRENYWGVINHENEEGIFRISDNVETPGMKFWTWGRNNVDNNMFDFSNGGADNYIELWAGVSEAFFEDATLQANEVKSWKESYGPTINLRTISNINNSFAGDIRWDTEEKKLYYDLFSFLPNGHYRAVLSIDGESSYTISDENIIPDKLGSSKGFYIENVEEGTYIAGVKIYDVNEEMVFSAEKEISLSGTDIHNTGSDKGLADKFKIIAKENKIIHVYTDDPDEFDVLVFNINGQELSANLNQYTETLIRLNSRGLYIVKIRSGDLEYQQKIYLY